MTGTRYVDKLSIARSIRASEGCGLSFNLSFLPYHVASPLLSGGWHDADND